MQTIHEISQVLSAAVANISELTASLDADSSQCEDRCSDALSSSVTKLQEQLRKSN